MKNTIIKKPIVYIASPYSLGDMGVNVKRQHDMFETLLTTHFLPYAPLLTHYQHIIHPHSYDVWLDMCFQWVVRCDVLLRLEGESKGADREVDLATQLGIPVVYNLKELANWRKTYWDSIEISWEEYDEYEIVEENG